VRSRQSSVKKGKPIWTKKIALALPEKKTHHPECTSEMLKGSRVRQWTEGLQGGPSQKRIQFKDPNVDFFSPCMAKKKIVAPSRILLPDWETNKRGARAYREKGQKGPYGKRLRRDLSQTGVTSSH